MSGMGTKEDAKQKKERPPKKTKEEEERENQGGWGGTNNLRANKRKNKRLNVLITGREGKNCQRRPGDRSKGGEAGGKRGEPMYPNKKRGGFDTSPAHSPPKSGYSKGGGGEGLFWRRKRERGGLQERGGRPRRTERI